MRQSSARPARATRGARDLRAAQETFLTTGSLPDGLDPWVADSWRRSASSGVDPDEPHAVVRLGTSDLDAYRDAHPLSAAMPVVRELLVEAAVEEGMVVAVSDDAGRL